MSKENKEPFFNHEMQKKAVEWLNKKWLNKKCECCGNNNWDTADFLVAPLRFEGSMTIGGKIMPQVVATCSNCGNTKYFNAVMMNILVKERKDEND